MNAKTKEAPTLTPITATIPKGKKGLALTGVPESWASTRSLAVSKEGDEIAFLGNDGIVYQSRFEEITPQALAWGYVFGAKQKADSDGASDKERTGQTALKITGTVGIDDWVSRAERVISVDPMSAQVRAILLTRLGPLGKAIKEKGVKLTGFSGSVDGMLSRYAAVVKEVTGKEATEEQWETFTGKVREEATAALAQVDENPFA